jgi:hypothetical protein
LAELRNVSGQKQTSSVNDSNPEEADDTAADHVSQAMDESARVEVQCAEVRVFQVGNRQITRFMYRQLDEAAPERFQPLGRVRDKKRIPMEWGKPQAGVLQLVGRDSTTRALVRYDAQPPNWYRREGPSEYAHWLLHTEQSGPYRPAGAGGRVLEWTGNANPHCAGPSGWHISK